jgi:hypothetical protein
MYPTRTASRVPRNNRNGAGGYSFHNAARMRVSGQLGPRLPQFGIRAVTELFLLRLGVKCLASLVVYGTIITTGLGHLAPIAAQTQFIQSSHDIQSIVIIVTIRIVVVRHRLVQRFQERRSRLVRIERFGVRGWIPYHVTLQGLETASTDIEFGNLIGSGHGILFLETRFRDGNVAVVSCASTLGLESQFLRQFVNKLAFGIGQGGREFHTRLRIVFAELHECSRQADAIAFGNGVRIGTLVSIL